MAITTALIGCGRIGFLLEDDPLRYKPCTHAGGAATAGLKITHACDIDENRLKLFSQRYHIKGEDTYLHHHDLLNNTIPDIAIIATWTDSHCSIAMDCISKGTRIVVMEKPLGSNLKEAGELLKLCEETGTRLVVNHERRFDGRYRKVKELLDSGKLGDLLSITGGVYTAGNFGLSQEKQGGGPLLHDGTHLVDIMRFYGGDISTVRGTFFRKDRERGFETGASVYMTTAQGTDLFCQAGGGADYFHFEVDLMGTRGRIIIGNGFNRYYKGEKSRYYKGFRDLKEVPFPKYKEVKSFTELYKYVKKLSRDKEVPPVSTGMDGYRALEIIHGSYLSAHKKKEISLPIKPSSVNLRKIFSL